MRAHVKLWPLFVAAFVLACEAAPRQFTAADEKVVRDMADITVASFKSANFGPWLDLWTDDAILQPPNAPAVAGREGRAAWSKAFPSLEDLRFDNVRVTGDGNLAYGTTTYMLKPRGMPADSGKQLFIARRQDDGKWKLVAGSFNSDLPAPGSAGGPAPTLAGEPRAAAAATFTSRDSSSIIALNARLERAGRSHRWDDWSAEFAANPVRMPPNMKTIAGRVAVDAFNHSGPNVTEFEIRVASIAGNGSMAFASGEYHAAAPAGKDASGKATPAMMEDGKFMQQLARQPDGSWKIVRDIWNSNLPAPKLP
jgi:ketosteroid isomerase-like protein